MEERVLKILRQNNGEILQYQGQNMIEDGIIDSLDMINIVSDLENEIGIVIMPEDVNGKNFATKETVIRLIQQISI